VLFVWKLHLMILLLLAINRPVGHTRRGSLLLRVMSCLFILYAQFVRCLRSYNGTNILFTSFVSLYYYYYKLTLVKGILRFKMWQRQWITLVFSSSDLNSSTTIDIHRISSSSPPTISFFFSIQSFVSDKYTYTLWTTTDRRYLYV
jgi:hypothetical protein